MSSSTGVRTSRSKSRLRTLHAVAIAVILIAAALTSIRVFGAGAPATLPSALLFLLALLACALVAVLDSPVRFGRRLAGFFAVSASSASGSRRSLIVGAVVLWFIGTASVYALPGLRTRAVLVVAEPGLREWAAEAIRRDAALGAIDWQIVTPEEAGASQASRLWLALDRRPEVQALETATVARSPYVVVAWASSLQALGLQQPGPVDLAALQPLVSTPNGPTFVIPTGATPLGSDALYLLALARRGQGETDLDTDPAQDTALQEWLRPFVQRQSRTPRQDEAILFDDWVRYRATLGDAGLLPEHVALQTVEVVQAQAPLHIRYPTVNLWRQYVLAAESGFDPAVHDQLRATLLAPDAQQALGIRGFRSVQATPPPTSGPFVTLGANGVDWNARWAETPRDAAFDEWARGWQP